MLVEERERAVSSTLQSETELLEEPGTVRIVKSVLKEVLDTSSMCARV